jgi:hypothetical protein
MITIYLLKFVSFWFAIFVAVIFIYFFYKEFKRWRRRKEIQKLKYNMIYKHIQSYMDKHVASEIHYDYLKRKLSQLECLPYKNNEKTEVLNSEFDKRYAKIAKERASEEEFAPQNVFSINLN